MLDMSDMIEAKSDQLTADDLIGGPKTITITEVSKQVGDQPCVIKYEGMDGKPYLPAKSMRRVLVFAWGKNGQDYVGKSLTLFRDPEVTWAGAKVGGIRISHMSDIKKKLVVSLTATRNNKKPYTVEPLVITKVKPAVTAKLDPKLVEAGAHAAKSGVEAYKGWLAKLSPEEKASIKPNHKEWSAIAKTADEPVDIEIVEDDDEAPAM